MPKIETQDGEVVDVSKALLSFNSQLSPTVTRIQSKSENVRRVIALTEHYRQTDQTAEKQRRRYSSLERTGCFDEKELEFLELTTLELKDFYNTAVSMGNNLCLFFAVRAILQKNMQIYAKA